VFSFVLFPTDPGEFDQAKAIHSAVPFCFTMTTAAPKKWGTHQRIV
jgi:hypothetical protein